MPTVITTIGKELAVNSIRSNLGRSGLIRSCATDPNSGINKYNMNWRKVKVDIDPNWRTKENI